VAKYSLRLKPSAAKEIESIGVQKIRRRVVERISALAEEPRPPGCEKLSGEKSLFRVRQGAWRIVYSIEDDVLVVVVVKVAHRREVYRRL